MRISKKQSAESTASRRKVIWPRGLLAILLLGVAIAGVTKLARSFAAHPENSKGMATSAPVVHKFAVEIRKPSGPPRVTTALKDAHGNSVTVACSSCHTTRPPNHLNKTVQDLDEFHVGMAFSHGTVSCLSCHNSNDYDSLKLADNSQVEFSDVMTLCTQCHGPQMNDFMHGAHGGMNGYWDLSRGPQQKNNCVDCHNPHSPQFPKMQPTFKPKDRFLEVHK